MKKFIALALLAFASQASAIFAGEPAVPSKEVIAPLPASPPGFFRPNEFDLGAFGTYATGVGDNSGSLHAWGGGLDLTYWFPWKYAGVRFQGTGASISEVAGIEPKRVAASPLAIPLLRSFPGSPRWKSQAAVTAAAVPRRVS